MNRNTSKQEQPIDKLNPKVAGASQSIPEKSGSATRPEDITAVRFLEKQHVELQGLFAQMEQETTQTGRRMLLERCATFLRNHSAIEERHFYPAVLNEETEKLLKEARKEHREAEEKLGELFQCESFDEDFVKEFDDWVEEVQHHIHEEENELFPMVAKEIPGSTLVRVGEEMQEAYRFMAQSGPSISDKVRTTQRNEHD